MGETQGFFSRVIEAGFHQKAIQMVVDGQVDAAATDCHVLALELRDHPEFASQLKIIDTLGPSTIQPVAVSRQMSLALKETVRDILTEMHRDPAMTQVLNRGLVARFVPVTNADYDDIRAMLVACQHANFMQIR